MAHNKKKTSAARLGMEAQRRQADAARITAARQEQRLADIRRLLREGAERQAFERRLAAALAVTDDDFGWKPWGYELPAPPKVAGLSVRHLWTVPDRPRLRLVPEPELRARQRFERPVRVLSAVAA